MASNVKSPEHISSKEIADTPPNAFDELVERIRKALGPSSGIGSADVDADELQELMRNYISKCDEWERYAFRDGSRNYTRNLVEKGNGKSNLLILVWSPGKSSPIHDHANSHCIMKVLKGRLKETLYSWPEGTDPSAPHIMSESVYGENQVTYISDKIGLHSVGNVDPDQYAVSLHLYTPPNAALYGCNIYDKSTGRSSHVLQSNYYSLLGVKA